MAQLSLFAQPNIKTVPTPQPGEQVGSKWVVNGEQKPEIKTLQDELEENNINLNARPDTCPRCGIKIGKNHIIVNFNKKLYDSDFLCQGCAWEIKELSESKNKQKPESWQKCASCKNGDCVTSATCGKAEPKDKKLCQENNFMFYELLNPETGNPVLEAQPEIERILRPYCMICQTTENVRYVEKEKAHYCATCEVTYCA